MGRWGGGECEKYKKSFLLILLILLIPLILLTPLTPSLSSAEARQLFTCFGIMGVNCTHQARIKGSGDMTYFYRVSWISNGYTYQGFFNGATLLFGIARSDVPCCRGNDLIVLDFAIF
jgi:hypothetical protein